MRHLFRLSFFLLSILLTFAVTSAQEGSPSSKDVLQEALSLVNLTRHDLGYRPKGYWNRFPNPQLIPYKLPCFDDLFNEPLRTYDFAKTMGNAVRQYLNANYLGKNTNTLHQVIYFLGVDRKVGGFRNYSVNLAPQVDDQQPMLRALEKVYEAAGERMEYFTFGDTATWPNRKREVEAQVKSIGLRVQKVMAALILNMLDAYRWRQVAVRNVPVEKLTRAFFIRDLGETQGNAMKYYPEIDDIAAVIDEQSLYYSAMKAAQATEEAKKSLWSLLKEKGVDTQGIRFDHLTPIGRIVMTGSSDDVHDYTDCALLVDFGGNDTYRGGIGATPRLDIPVSIAIDLQGNDTYRNDYPTVPSQGAGIFGTGILLDVDGDDSYSAKTFAQGAGFFGLGLLFDERGDDRYTLETSGQGVGYFGIGMTLDVAGDDEYYLQGDGQGFGGVAGVGILANGSGRDHYTAEPYASKANRGDYHSNFIINANNAQGVGMGRRGDGADGHSWAGGLGALIDIEGDDEYLSGNWSLGTGYWFGVGIVYEGAGNDVYKSCYFTQASGAHYCLGTLIDEGGDDVHTLFETAGAALGFGWDFTGALFVDKGGNDRYEAKTISLGCAQIRSNAFFFELGGNDEYQLGRGQQGMGAATFQKEYATPSLFSPYLTYAKSVGLFLDIGGRDHYWEWDVKSDKLEPSPTWRDRATWLSPRRDAKEFGYGNFGVGMDVEAGVIPEVVAF